MRPGRRIARRRRRRRGCAAAGDCLECATRTMVRPHPRCRRPSRATTRGAPPFAPCASRRRCVSTAGSTRRSTSTVQPASDFIQMEPNGGQTATEKTEVWVAFDRDNLYVSFRAWESEPDRTIANEMRRDSNNIRQGDSVGFSPRHVPRSAECDPVRGECARRHDRRSEHERTAVQRGLEPGLEARRRQVRRWMDHRGRDSVQVDPVCARDRSGLGIPVASHQQVEERDRLPDEDPAGVRPGPRRLLRVAVRDARRHRGAAAVAHPRAEAVCDRRCDHRQRLGEPPHATIPDGDVGVDAKYSITQNLTADLTYNTDFAQVEADEQQVNLTRFSLFFPEKRDFFLENQGIFTFGNNSTASERRPARRRAGALLQPAHRPRRTTARCRSGAAAASPAASAATSSALINMQTKEDADCGGAVHQLLRACA